MNKPHLSDYDCKELANLVYTQIPWSHKALLRYGFGVFSLGASAIISAQGSLSVFAAAVTAAIFIGVLHFVAREEVGFVPALNIVDQHEVTPEGRDMKYLIEYLRSIGVNIRNNEYPELVKIGLRTKAIRRIENGRSIALSIAGYCGLLLVAAMG